MINYVKLCWRNRPKMFLGIFHIYGPVSCFKMELDVSWSLSLDPLLYNSYYTTQLSHCFLNRQETLLKYSLSPHPSVIYCTWVLVATYCWGDTMIDSHDHPIQWRRGWVEGGENSITCGSFMLHCCRKQVKLLW